MMNHNKQIVEIQLGRKLRSSVNVVTKCHFNLPVVIKVPPNLDDGTPFPTTYWLSCPMYTKKVGSLESTGLIKELDDQIQKDKNLYESISSVIVPFIFTYIFLNFVLNRNHYNKIVRIHNQYFY